MDEMRETREPAELAKLKRELILEKLSPQKGATHSNCYTMELAFRILESKTGFDCKLQMSK